MNSIHINLFILVIFASFAHAKDERSARNMIILLDQEGFVENIGRPVWHYLSCKFQSALQEQASPILINAALLNTFIEKRKSIEQISKISQSDEEKTIKTYDSINDRLNSSYQSFRAKGIDPIQSKQLMLEVVNKEFYALPTLIKHLEQKENPEIKDEQVQALRSYLTQFKQHEWETYTNQKSLYLFIPKKYIAELEKKEPQHAPINNLSKKEMLLGLKVDHLTPVVTIEDSGRLYFDSQLPSNKAFTDHIEDFFVTKDDLKDSPMPYHWNIALSGHGGTQYVEDSDSYADATVADLKITDFQKLLTFLNNKINTKALHYATCEGSGKRIKMLFDDAGNPKYNFAIISDCLSDGDSYCKIRNFNFPSFKQNTLTAKDITCDEHGNWHLLLDYGYKWKKFFKELANNTFDDNLQWLYPALMHVTEDLLATISLIRVPQSTMFIPILPDTCARLNNALIDHTSKEENQSLVFTNRYAILIESSNIPLPIVIENSIQKPRIISLHPGNSAHFIRSIKFKKSDGVLNAFWPIDGDRFDRKFIIEELNFHLNNDSAAIKLLNLIDSDSEVSLKNVFIHIQKGNILRLFFQTKLGKAYMLVANKLDIWATDISLKGIHELTPEVAEIYLSRYNQIKSSLHQEACADKQDDGTK